MSTHVLVVEDEQKLANVLARYLEAKDYRTTVLHKGDRVLDTISRGQIDIVLLDCSLPGVDGLTLCRQTRAVSDVPIIMVTGRVEERERIAGLEAGADDYICKPFSLGEVAARVNAMLRRRPVLAQANGRLHIDDIAHAVFWDGKELELTLVEYRLLKTLYSSPDRAFTRDELINDIYADKRIVTDRTIDVHVKNLRHKLQAGGLAEVITTIYGLGYRWHNAGAGRPTGLPGLRNIQAAVRCAAPSLSYHGTNQSALTTVPAAG